MASPVAGSSPSLGEKRSTSLPDREAVHLHQTGKNAIFGKKPKHHVQNWTGNDVDFTMVDEKATLRKMDIRLIPVLAILYLLSFLDRGNIGNAKIQGLTKDLKLEGNQYNLCLTGMLVRNPLKFARN
jgi:hypothetical protein